MYKPLMGKRNRNKSSPNICERASVKKTSNGGKCAEAGLSPVNQGLSFSMHPTYSYVPQYTTLRPMPAQAPVDQQAHNVIQPKLDLMVQILQRLDKWTKSLDS